MYMKQVAQLLAHRTYIMLKVPLPSWVENIHKGHIDQSTISSHCLLPGLLYNLTLHPNLKRHRRNWYSSLTFVFL